jgi:hypothetical protein
MGSNESYLHLAPLAEPGVITPGRASGAEDTMIAYDALGAAEEVRYKYEKLTGLWVWASFKTLVGIFGQTAGPACANPLTFRFTVAKPCTAGPSSSR